MQANGNTPRSVFANAAKKHWAEYEVQLTFTGRLIGGIPKDPNVIEGWIRSKAGVTSAEEIRQMTLRTIAELDPDITLEELQSMTYEQALEASKRLAGLKSTVGFKMDDQGLYLESRQFKAMLKEDTNIGFEGEGWLKRAYKSDPSKTTVGKNPRAVVAERVFVHPEKIYLGNKDGTIKTEPDGIWMFVGHVPESRGSLDKRSTLTYYEYVDRPVLSFTVRVFRDVVAEDDWAIIWSLAEENGAGAVRSQSQGMFVTTRWERVQTPTDTKGATKAAS